MSGRFTTVIWSEPCTASPGSSPNVTPGKPIRYTIVGFGSEAELAAIRKAVIDTGLQDTVLIRDRVDHGGWCRRPSLSTTSAFTPRVPWFEHQPSTKVSEYLQSGLLCIASDTTANREVISDASGVLIDDTAGAFAEGLDRIWRRLTGWDPRSIADGVLDRTWEQVVTDRLVPVLESARK